MMKNMMSEKHEFAIWAHDQITENHTAILIRDEKLLHRLMRILRLQQNDICILFDKNYSWRCKIISLTQKEGVFDVLEKQQHRPLTPSISWAIPLLEPADFEKAIYAVTAMGAATIQPLITRKSRHHDLTTKELQRLERIMLAAAEQSKQFILPIMLPVLDFNRWLDHQILASNFLFFDTQGAPCFSMLEKLRQHRTQEILCLVGPEGDLTQEEKKHLQQRAHFVALVPSVLRASDAIMIGMGILRSCIH